MSNCRKIRGRIELSLAEKQKEAWVKWNEFGNIGLARLGLLD